ncbi:MAG: histidine--tRNA ligase [Fimbriimonas sp.]
MRYQAPRGTEDVLPADSFRWIWLENEFRRLVRLYGYQEIRTPTFEDADLFIRTSGETSDIVTKQIYAFRDRGDRDVALKPEGTAPAIRAMVEAGLLTQGNLSRISYVTPIFRYERPQKGRLREAHQFGFELIGSTNPRADAEVIELTVRFYQQIGIEDVKVSLNSLGRTKCRARYREALLEFARPLLADQTEEARAKFELNPLRILDSKDEALQAALRDAPKVLDYLEDDSRARFDRLQQLLTDGNVPFEVSPEIVRGLDYYTETVFEVLSTRLGSQSALCGGGRYDHLIKELGGPEMPSVGVGMGVERALIVLDSLGKNPAEPKPQVFVVGTGGGSDVAIGIARELRAAGIATQDDIEARSVKSQLRQADKSGASLAIFVGDDEVSAGTATLRSLATGEQGAVPLASVLSEVRARL